MTNNTKYIVALKSGFYLYGEIVQENQDGWLVISNCYMFGGFSGGKGLPGVARGDTSAKVTLDKFQEDVRMPISNTLFIADSIELETFSGTTIR